MNAKIKKTTLGQFFTKSDFWLKDHILEFIRKVNSDTAFDPFAGAGDLLFVAKQIGIKKIVGMDIDESLDWKTNDSLVSIPRIENSITITNPPYLANHSAKRKGIYENVKKYFTSCDYDDLYQLAIEKCMVNDYGVMIVPETFINSNFPKHRLVSITIIEDQLFTDTENPTCVICFDNKNKAYTEIKVYKNNTYLGNLGFFEKMRYSPAKNVFIKFNSPKGQIALRAVDTTDPARPISFMRPEKMDYDLADIRHSSRLITAVEMRIKDCEVDLIIENSNNLLFDFRKRTHDILLSPFKGNKKNGERRRRLDYQTARVILENAFELSCQKSNSRLFN